MVDSNDRERVNEAREELMRMLAEDELRDAVLLVFANKQVCPVKMFFCKNSWKHTLNLMFFSVIIDKFSVNVHSVLLKGANP